MATLAISFPLKFLEAPMQRQTPQDSSLRGYQGGGCITCVPEVDDSKGIQESVGSRGMKSESWPTNISPQNYGFTSVIADAIKNKAGAIQQVAEGFMSFMGGNRQFPLCSIMDDRRHRLKNLGKDAAKGATAMFGLKEWGQQLLNTEDGWFMTGNTQKKMRLQLVGNQNGQQQPGGGPQGATRSFRSKSGVEFDIELLADGTGVSALAAGGSSGSSAPGAGESGPGGQTGQKTLHKEDSTTYVDMTSQSIHQVNGSANHEVTTKKATGYYSGNEKSYRADDDHSHIKYQGAHIWVDGACKASMPIIIEPDPCS